jgi:adenylate cyclase
MARRKGSSMTTPEPDRIERRLAAIFVADIAGYSRLMGADEAGTARTFKEHRAAVDPLVTAFGGRIVKTTGDGVLVEFPSIVSAVECAAAVQKLMADRNANVPEDKQMLFRIGVHLGDVLIEDDDILGDGVNIAARLEGVSDPGGICISSAAYDHVRGKVAIEFRDAGEQTLRNISYPVRAYKVALGRLRTTAASPLRDKPSIAVLPFQNMCGDPEQEYFGDGLAEEVITTLSHISNLLVIARNSSFTYKGKTIDVRQIGKDLGVQYALEGSVRKTGNRLRVTAQLIDTRDGSHLWANRYDRNVGDIFDVQDELTKEIVTALRLKLTDGEQARAWLRATDDVQAWSHFVEGMEHVAHITPAETAAACECFGKAAIVDPDYSVAFAFKAWTHYIDVRMGFTDTPARSTDLMETAARRSLEIDPGQPHGHGALGGVFSLKRRFDDAIREGEIAVRDAPNDAHLRAFVGRLMIVAGRPEEGVRHMRVAMRLHPFYPTFYLGIAANGLEELGRDQEAIEHLLRAVQRDPNYFAGHLRLASLYGLADRSAEASAALAEALRINPRFKISMAETFYSSVDPNLTNRFVEGLRKAGLPA